MLCEHKTCWWQLKRNGMTIDSSSRVVFHLFFIVTIFITKPYKIKPSSTVPISWAQPKERNIHRHTATKFLERSNNVSICKAHNYYYPLPKNYYKSIVACAHTHKQSIEIRWKSFYKWVRRSFQFHSPRFHVIHDRTFCEF